MAIIKLDGGYNALPISYKRGNPIPLDTTAVWYDETELRTYAASGVTAYVGQVLSLVSEVKNDKGEVTGHTSTAYIITDTNGNLEPIGTAPVGDETSIVVAEDGTVSLKGIDGLDFNKKNAEGENVLDDEGNPVKVTYQPLMTEAGLTWIIPSETTVEGLATLIAGLDTRITSLETTVGNETKGLVKGLADEAKRADEAEKALAASIKAIVDDYVKADDIKDFETKENVKKVADDLAAYKKEVATELDKKATVDALNALKGRVDAFLTGEGTEAALDSLQELIEYINTHDDYELASILVTLSELETAVAEHANSLDSHGSKIYNLEDTSYQLSVLTGLVPEVEGSASFHTLPEQIAEAKAAAIEAAALDTTNKANAAKEAAIAHADAELAKKADADSVYLKSQTYSIDQIDDLLESIQAGSSESAASVKAQLDAYKKSVNTEVWGNEDGTGDSRIDALEKIGAQANVIEAVVPGKDNTLLGLDEIKTVGKTVTIDDAKIVLAIGGAKTAAQTAQTAAGEAQAKADSNASNISSLGGRMDEAEGKIDANIAAIKAHASEYAKLKGAVEGQAATLLEKANASAVYTKEEVNAITGTLETGKTLVAMIATKADAENVYTKTDVYTKTETNTEIKKVTDSIGTVPTGSTVMAEIANITKADGGLIAVAKQEALDAVDDLANGAVADNTAAIAILNGAANKAGSVAKIADDRIAAALAGADTDFDTLKEMSDWLSKHKGSAAEMNSAINDNTAAIGVINNTTIPAAIQTANKHADDKFAEIVLADIVATEVEGTVTKTAKKGLVLPEVDKFEMTDGKVTAISTDLLKNGSMTLVLNGGTATSSK